MTLCAIYWPRWPCVQLVDPPMTFCTVYWPSMTLCAVSWPSMYDVLCSLLTSMTFYAVNWSRWPFVHLVDPLWPLVQFIDHLWPFMQFIDLNDLVCSLLTLMTLCAVRWPPYDLLCSSLTLMTLCAVHWPLYDLLCSSLTRWPCVQFIDLPMTFCAVHWPGWRWRWPWHGAVPHPAVCLRHCLCGQRPRLAHVNGERIINNIVADGKKSSKLIVRKSPGSNIRKSGR